ncbi:MAG: DNA polymerase III subunit chi [Thiothrix sp.]|nr:DNA polymerase III subunit chi [Thiothrix sp.]HPQ97139.1 DNA polymerase III subunit chi [Thiolinea sp.]
MTRISFYIGRTHSLQARLLLACRLIDKAFARSMHVYVHADNHSTCAQLDELIWTWNDTSFIPHGMAPDAGGDTRVLLGYDFEPMAHCDYLINLSRTTPEFFPRFARMAEILDQEEEVLHAGRKRYKFYQARGYDLDYYQL